jgi:hypothetical protein
MKGALYVASYASGTVIPISIRAGRAGHSVKVSTHAFAITITN